MWAVLKRDLGEFVTTLKDDATDTLKAAMTLHEQRAWYGSEIDGTESDVPQHSRHGEERVSAALRSLRADTNTYTKDITDAERESYASFMRTFDLGARTKEIATLFEEDSVLTGIHTDLVPDHLTYNTFWCRYFFRTERVQKGLAAGISFPQDDEEDDDDFGWDEDEQDDAGDEDRKGQGDAEVGSGVVWTSSSMPTPAEDPTESGSARVPGAAAKASSADAAPHASQEVDAVEIMRLKEALRRTEDERDAAREAAAKADGRAPSTDAQLIGGVSDGRAGEEVDRLTRERDAAVAQVQALASRLSQADLGRNHARASAEDEPRDLLEASEACAVAADAGTEGDSAATGEIARLKAALREEHAQHERMMLESRKAAKEAVEAALSSADADRDEACAEIEAKLAAEVKKREGELEVLRARLERQAEAAAGESSALKREIAELRSVMEAKEQEALEARREARQQGDVVTQLREENRMLQAASEVSRALTSASGPAMNRSGVSGTPSRGAHARSDNGVGDDTDGWGDEDDSLTAVSTNSSAVVVDHSPRDDHERDNEGHASPAAVPSVTDTHGRSQADGVDEEVKQGRSSEPSRTVREDASDEEHRDGEGDDGWDGWD